ncbi:spike base protein, RCAP_Rcc01079 family [Leisingera thetidis]|uniref:spike base protein, RCAP_Rcc01079 family n=1 Tax=Leisingera thetidis TaxID=2930199 RepID=UPI0021F719C7|nr:hypothetical protein [Leisingera thetidis]
MPNPFKNHQRGLESPATEHFQITPADGADLDPCPRVLRVTGSGDLALRDAAGQVLIYNVVAGETLCFSARGIEATGTTASVVGWL